MSISYDLANCTELNSLPNIERTAVIERWADAILFGLLGIGMNKLSRDNFTEVCHRLALVNSTTFMYATETPRFGSSAAGIPLSDTLITSYHIPTQALKAFIGMRTNISANVTHRRFIEELDRSRLATARAHTTELFNAKS